MFLTSKPNNKHQHPKTKIEVSYTQAKKINKSAISMHLVMPKTCPNKNQSTNEHLLPSTSHHDTPKIIYKRSVTRNGRVDGVRVKLFLDTKPCPSQIHQLDSPLDNNNGISSQQRKNRGEWPEIAMVTSLTPVEGQIRKKSYANNGKNFKLQTQFLHPTHQPGLAHRRSISDRRAGNVQEINIHGPVTERAAVSPSKSDRSLQEGEKKRTTCNNFFQYHSENLETAKTGHEEFQGDYLNGYNSEQAKQSQILFHLQQEEQHLHNRYENLCSNYNQEYQNLLIQLMQGRKSCNRRKAEIDYLKEKLLDTKQLLGSKRVNPHSSLFNKNNTAISTKNRYSQLLEVIGPGVLSYHQKQ